ncbi:MAG: glycogen/starch/alpha-glucan phosphorylase, partial [Clostridiales bacterium]|nr:glycogen/starch/alpha-glucan phosphorylase [Clostridiales bacterium]
MNKTELMTEFLNNLSNKYDKQPKDAKPYELHDALSTAVMDSIGEAWETSRSIHQKSRKASYLSMEFLVGRAIYNNLLCTGELDKAKEIFEECGVSLADIEEIKDSALGNGGLGRLAACFLDSAATLDLPLDGYGIRYKYGLFSQSFKDGFQMESADDWTIHGDPWSIRKAD